MFVIYCLMFNDVLDNECLDCEVKNVKGSHVLTGCYFDHHRERYSEVVAICCPCDPGLRLKM